MVAAVAVRYGTAAEHSTTQGTAETSKGNFMRTLKTLITTATLFAGLALASTAQAQIYVNIGVQPDCPYGYYGYAPYECAPAGYYGPGYFYNGIFLGMGPWGGWGYSHGWGRHRFSDEGGGDYHDGPGRLNYRGNGYRGNGGRHYGGPMRGGGGGAMHQGGGGQRQGGGGHPGGGGGGQHQGGGQRQGGGGHQGGGGGQHQDGGGGPH